MNKVLRELFELYAKRLLTNKVRPSFSEEGILTIPNKLRVEKMAQSLYKDFKEAGVPDNILKTENDIKVFHHKIAEINNENIVNQFDTLMSESTLFNPKKSADVFDLKGNKIKDPQNIMGGEELIDPNSEIAKSIRLENESKKLANSMSDAEIKLRGSRPYDTDEQILQRLKKGNKDSINRLKNKKDPPEELATGGIAGLRQGYDAGSKVIKYGKDIFNLLKNKKKLQKAFDNIFTTDDYKMDMEMVAESLVELNPKVFKNKLYDDLPDELRSEIYGAAMNVVNKDRALKLQLRKGAVDAKLVDEVVPEINRESMKLVDGKFETTKAPRKFKLNVDTFVRDFPVDRTEAERIATLSSKEQKVIIDKYLNNDMKQRVELMNFDPPKDRKPNAIGGRIGYYGGSSVDHAVRTMDPVQDSGHKIDKVLGAYKKYRRGEKNPRLSFSKFFELFSAETFATGGRAGYYGGGITNMVGEDLSEIGHGSDALMSRNMQLAPNSMATTSTGLNYLLGQDNDTARVPYNEGNMVLPKPKPQDPMIELKRVYDLYAKASPGVSQETQKYLQQDFIEKLNKANISQEAFMTDRMQKNFKAEGGRAAFSAGGFNAGRRGFLKIMGATAAGITAFKSGALKLLTAGKATSAIPKVISGTTGTPVWFENVVNKVLAEGVDVTTKLAIKDGQIVKSLDTPTGKVDVYYDNKTGALDLDYAGTNTSMGEAVNMRYTPGEAIETGVAKGTKTDEVFEATESIPEFQGGNYMDGPDLDFGENMTSNIDDLYSDTSELATLGGEKLLVKDISNTLKKKKVLKEMDNNPDQFASDNLPDYDY